MDDVPKGYFREKRVIYGFVERVIDGDTIRVRHVPGYAFHRKKPEPLQQRGIAKDTLSIRIYAVDTPETAKSKNGISQPFGDEATAFTTKLVLHKVVKITLLRKDQYRRAVAVVETVPSPLAFLGFGIVLGRRRKDVSLELTKAGLAELYTGGGAEYNNNLPKLQKALDRAKRRKKGIWSLPNRVSAADYKKQQRTRHHHVVPVGKSSSGGNSKRKNNNRKKNKKTKSAPTKPKKKKTGAYVAAFKEAAKKDKQKNGATNVLETVVTGLEFVP